MEAFHFCSFKLQALQLSSTTLRHQLQIASALLSILGEWEQTHQIDDNDLFVSTITQE